jgi:hypothetical protein
VTHLNQHVLAPGRLTAGLTAQLRFSGDCDVKSRRHGGGAWVVCRMIAAFSTPFLKYKRCSRAEDAYPGFPFFSADCQSTGISILAFRQQEVYISTASFWGR